MSTCAERIGVNDGATGQEPCASYDECSKEGRCLRAGWKAPFAITVTRADRERLSFRAIHEQTQAEARDILRGEK